ncbi:hypothetical protein ACFQ0T_14095 [Kitasatospora gansuensis]
MAVTEQEALRITQALEAQLDKRQAAVKVWNGFYKGKSERLVFASDRFRQAFGGLFDGFSDNWCGVVCDAPSERMTPLGFRFGEGEDGAAARPTSRPSGSGRRTGWTPGPGSRTPR